MSIQILKQFGINLVSNLALESSGLNKFNEDYFFLKQGTLLYLVNRGQAMALGLNPSWNVEDILNEIAFNSLSVYVIDTLNVPEAISSALNLDANSTSGVVVLQSVLMSAIQEAGYLAEQHPDLNVVKRLVTLVRSKINM